MRVGFEDIKQQLIDQDWEKALLSRKTVMEIIGKMHFIIFPEEMIREPEGKGCSME